MRRAQQSEYQDTLAAPEQRLLKEAGKPPVRRVVLEEAYPIDRAMKLSGKLTVVTGAGRGIGRAIALRQAEEGATVALLARSADAIAVVADEINRAGGVARAYALDVLDRSSVEASFDLIRRDMGPIALLTNNAAAFSAIGPIWDVDPDVWWRDLEISIRGAFNCCRAVLPAMIAHGDGRIINMVGGGAASSFPYGSGYGTGKAGLLRFTECVSDTLDGTGVRIFALDPGLVRTAMTEYQLASEAGRTWLPTVAKLFSDGIDVPPLLAARLTVEIGSGRFDRMAGRMLMAARGDLDLTPERIERIVREDLRSLRVNGVPAERLRDR